MDYKGINQDLQPRSTPPDFYYYAKNIVLNKKYGVISNEEGTNLIHTLNYPIIGCIEYPDGLVVFSTDGSVSEIGVLHDDVYRTVNSPLIASLDFSLDHPIVGEYKYSLGQNLIIAFTDNFNPPRILNIGSPLNPTVIEANDLNDTLLFPEAIPAILVPTSIGEGGSLRSGAYQFAVRYKNKDGSFSSFFSLTNPVYITEDSIAEGEAYDGVDADTLTSKSVSLSLSNLDLSYDFVEIAVIQTISFVTNAYITPQIPIGVSSYIINSTASLQELSLEEVYIPKIQYSKAKTITQLNDRLYLGNLETKNNVSYQRYANLIRLDYEFVEVPAYNVYADIQALGSDKTNYLRSYQPGEVYAFYIVLNFKDGTRSPAYHIPGRDPEGLELSPSSPSTSITGQRYEFFDTTTTSLQSNLGFWQNKNEFYPDSPEFDSSGLGGRDLRGQNVKHHRFPTIQKIFELFYDGTVDEESFMTGVGFKLGIRASMMGLQMKNPL